MGCVESKERKGILTQQKETINNSRDNNIHHKDNIHNNSRDNNSHHKDNIHNNNKATADCRLPHNGKVCDVINSKFRYRELAAVISSP
jgi:hypothetical protein